MNLSSFTQLTGRVSRLALLALAVSLAGVVQAKQQWHVYDVLGNTVASVNADAVVAEIESTAFGESRTPTAGARFTGKPYDADLGAHVFPFRNYRSDSGRWTSADPSGFPDGSNGSSYAASAFSEVDPLGLVVLVAQPSLPSPDSWQNVGQLVDVGLFSSTTYDVQCRVIYTTWMSAGGQTSTPGANTSFDLNLSLTNSVDASFTIGGDSIVTGSYATTASVTSGGGAHFGYTNPTAGLPSSQQLSIVHSVYYTRIGLEYRYRYANVLNASWSAVQSSSFVGYLPHWGEQVVE